MSLDAALYPSTRLTLREAALWSGAAVVVVGAHLLAAYLWYARAPDPPAAQVAEKALTIDLAPLSVSEPESVPAEAVPPAETAETIKPVEEALPLARATVEPVEPIKPMAPVEPEQTQTIAPTEQQVVEPEAAEIIEAKPVAPSELAALPPQELEPAPVTPEKIAPGDPDQVVLPTSDVPIPTPRPEPPVRTAEKPKPAREARKEEPAREARTKPPAESAAPASRGGASQAPRIDPARWQTKVVAWLNRHKRYPSAARSRGEEGTANVRFTIDSSGRVLSASIAKSSGSRLLDEAALDMVRRASPVPAPPAGIARSSITLGVPVSFQMR
jgi:protein TonB